MLSRIRERLGLMSFGLKSILFAGAFKSSATPANIEGTTRSYLFGDSENVGLGSYSYDFSSASGASSCVSVGLWDI